MTTASTPSIPKDTASPLLNSDDTVTTKPITTASNTPANTRIPPKLASINPTSNSFRMNAQPSPRSPRHFREKKSEKHGASEKTIASDSSSDPAPDTGTKSKNLPSSSLMKTAPIVEPPMSSSVPLLKIFKTQISSKLIEKLETECIDHALADCLIADLNAQAMKVDQRNSLGRTDSAFYTDRLPDALKIFTKGINQATISSSKLLQKVFSEEFRTNTGWAAAKIFYVNAMFHEKMNAGPQVGAADPATQNAEREKLKGLTGTIAESIFGKPAGIKNSPLPRRFIEFLIYADQRLHEQLLTGKSTSTWSTVQIRDTRNALMKHLTVTRLLMPMISLLADKYPSQKEIWCLGLTVQALLKSADELAKEIFVESFFTSSASLQTLAKQKEKQERIQQRTRELNARSKKTVGHVRSRSADTKIVDIDWLSRRDEVRNKRAQEKKEIAIEKTKQVLSQVEIDDDAYVKAISEGSRALAENEEVRKAESSIKDFSAEDLAQIMKMLDERDEEEIMDLLPDAPFNPERAQPLPTSTDALPPNLNSDGAHYTTPTEPEAKDGVFQE